MRKQSGVYYLPCKVNGLKLDSILDTGASNISISLSEALFMLKNGYLDEDDIRGSSYAQLANGELVKNTEIRIRKLLIGDLELKNIKAGIINNIDAPLLLGQSLLSRFGKVTIDYDNNLLIISAKKNSSPAINTPQQQIKIDNKYIVNVKALKDIEEAKEFTNNLKLRNFRCGYVWIRKYKSLGKAEYYTIYIGPYNTLRDCESAVEVLKNKFPDCYGTLVSNGNKRVVVRGKGKVSVKFVKE
ncbi:MAG: retroviral-like aspartic protease family protein [Bacteroidetes bacterium]|nr:retroviral-like aspartic protease family protein [Bacteroidota bacterium]